MTKLENLRRQTKVSYKEVGLLFNISPKSARLLILGLHRHTYKSGSRLWEKRIKVLEEFLFSKIEGRPSEHCLISENTKQSEQRRTKYKEAYRYKKKRLIG